MTDSSYAGLCAVRPKQAGMCTANGAQDKKDAYRNISIWRIFRARNDRFLGVDKHILGGQCELRFALVCKILVYTLTILGDYIVMLLNFSSKIF